MFDRRRVADSSRLARPPSAQLTLLVALLLVVAACGTNAPSGSASSAAPPSSAAPASASTGPTPVVDPATVYATIEAQVVEIRGLKPKAAVSPTILDEAGIKKYVADSFKKDNPPDVVASNERLLKAFALLPADASLTDLYISLLGSQVAGLYSPDDKKLYVVSKSGGLGGLEKTTFAHEFTHALQDQNFGVGALKLDELGESDRSLARLSLLEGDAVLTQTMWQTQHLTQAELGQIMAAATDDASIKILLDMPAILRESLLFPYTLGLGFVSGLQSSDGWAGVNTAYGRPPASTEQILHPDKYFTNEAPIAVALPKDLAARLGPGWKVALQDTFGEFQIQVWLKQNTTIPASAAVDAAAGWGGDRVAVVDGPNGTWGVALRTIWDTDADAVAFETAATPIVERLPDPAALLPGAGGPERWVLIGSDATVLQHLESALGLAG